jgi:cytochrome c-type biogenesis protein
LNFIGIIRIGFLNKNISFGKLKDKMGFFASLIFGLTFGISFSPCVGAFLGSALALAASEGSAISGIFMLLTYSLGLGIPFLISAILVDQFQSSFNFIRKHQKKINLFSGIFLILMGIITALGIFNDFAGLFL